MDTNAIFIPAIHEHLLFPSAKTYSFCNACGVRETIYGGYYCNELGCYDRFFHKDCVEAPLEIKHSSHPQHLLFLTNDNNDFGYRPCHFCGNGIYRSYYRCSTCEFKVHLTCVMKPSPLAIEHPLCHDHPLVFLKKRDGEFSCCEVCKNEISVPSYSCLQCNNVYFHLGCVHFSKELSHPCHSNHPLKLIDHNADIDADNTCLLCEEQVRKDDVRYHCSTCNFTSCLECTRNPPPLVIEHTKTHMHPLTCLSKRFSYTCDLCGEEGKTSPYICLQCDFVIHRKCIDLPRVININRHDHRISFTHHLGIGYSKCGVCHKSLSQYHGAYSCSRCPNYGVHSRCAIKLDIWDSVELEGTKDDTEDVSPFKVVGDGLINHFSHEKHHLKLYKNYIYRNEWLQCEACMHPLGFDHIYICEECSFMLHEKCANLPRKKRFLFGLLPYTLEVGTQLSLCRSCQIPFFGFIYKAQGYHDVDAHCGSLYEPFLHNGHLHPLYFQLKYVGRCYGCNNNVYYNVLGCDTCDFNLCCYCAFLPKKIWYRNDEHPLTLCYGEETSDNNWCDNCEKKLDPCKWFYTCFDCEITLHAQCILGDFSRLKIGQTIITRDTEFEVILNSDNTRPFCRMCHFRCKSSIILKEYDEDIGYICSRSCLMTC